MDDPSDFPDLDEDDKKALTRAAAKKLHEGLRGAGARKHDEFGLCSKCRHFRIVVRLKGAIAHKQAWCDQLPTRFEGLDPDMPVKDCALFWPVGAPTLREMMAEAKMVEGRDLIKGYL